MFWFFEAATLLSMIKDTLIELKSGDVDEHVRNSVDALLLEPISKTMEELSLFVKLILETLDADHFVTTREYRVRPELDMEMYNIATQLKRLQNLAEEALQDV